MSPGGVGIFERCEICQSFEEAEERSPRWSGGTPTWTNCCEGDGGEMAALGVTQAAVVCLP